METTARAHLSANARSGQDENADAAQWEFAHRAGCNGKARSGRYSEELGARRAPGRGLVGCWRASAAAWRSRASIGATPLFLPTTPGRRTSLSSVPPTGTPALLAALSCADDVLVGSLLNLTALVGAIPVGRDVTVICSGTDSRFALEDAYAAGRHRRGAGGAALRCRSCGGAPCRSVLPPVRAARREPRRRRPARDGPNLRHRLLRSGIDVETTAMAPVEEPLGHERRVSCGISIYLCKGLDLLVELSALGAYRHSGECNRCDYKKGPLVSGRNALRRDGLLERRL
jgi:hypothetical protein